MTYIERDIGCVIGNALGKMPVVVLTGMRQSGKTTFLQNHKEFRQRKYITFDDFAYLEAAKAAPEALLDTEGPIIIDEAQKCPEILAVIKRDVDEKRQPGRFLLSGSANFAFLRGISESLAGRSIYFTLHPMSLRETSGNISSAPFVYEFFKSGEIPGGTEPRPITEQDIFVGGMPSVCLKEVKDRELWFKGYEQTYLERDLRDFSKITDVISFRNLMHLTALRTGQILNISELGRDAKLTTPTASRYLFLLELSFITILVPPYLRNRATRLIKSPKMYLSDSGLACYLGGLTGFQREPLKGAMYETFVAQNLFAIIRSRWTQADLYFWHVQGRYEVDFVIESEDKCMAIEVKAATRWTSKDLKGLKAFVSTTPDCVAGILAYNGKDAVKLGEKLWAIPISLLLS
jgi:predicted AAA+ superfamily ATPase